MQENTRRPESEQAGAANGASGAIIRLEEFRRARSAAQTHGFHIRKLWLGVNSSPRAPYMPGQIGLLVDAVGNFDGSAFVPPKNQQNGERVYGTSARRERGFIFKISGRVARATLLTSIGLGS